MKKNSSVYCIKSNPKRCQKCCKMFEMLYILVITDQRESGLWGYSEAPIAKAFYLGNKKYSDPKKFIRGSVTHTDIIVKNLKKFLYNISIKNKRALTEFEIIKRTILIGLGKILREDQNFIYIPDIQIPNKIPEPERFIDRNIRHTASGVALYLTLNYLKDEFYKGVNFLLQNYEKVVESFPIITVPTLFRLDTNAYKEIIVSAINTSIVLPILKIVIKIIKKG